MGRDPVNLILQQKPSQALLVIGREGLTYASLISREIESTFAHTANILGKLEEHGLVKFEPDGSDNRVKRVGLTKKGELTVGLLEELAAVLEGRAGKGTARKKAAQKRAEFGEKLKMIRAQIQLISREEIEGRQSISQDDYVRIGRRLGPYRRELRKIIEAGGKGDVKQAEGLDGMIAEVFGERERLRG